MHGPRAPGPGVGGHVCTDVSTAQRTVNTLWGVEWCHDGGAMKGSYLLWELTAFLKNSKERWDLMTLHWLVFVYISQIFLVCLNQYFVVWSLYKLASHNG